MYIWNTLTGWVSSCCFPCCKSNPNENNNANTADTENNESTPLLLTEPSSSFSEAARRFLDHNQSSDSSLGPSFTTGYTDPMQTKKALLLFCFHAMIYFGSAVLVFSFLLEKKLSVVDSLYFATVLFSTIGYGDIFPQDDIGRLFTMALATYGIVILGIFLGIYGEAILDHHTISAEKNQKVVRKAVCEVMEQNALSTIVESQTDSLQSSKKTSTNSRPSISAKTSVKTQSQATSTPSPPSGPVGTEEVAQEMEQMVESIKENKPGNLLTDIFFLVLDELPILIVLALIGVVIGHFEGWDVLMSLYWTFITGTTIGLGDKSPHNEYSRLACVLFLPLCVAVLGEVLSRIAGIYLSRKRCQSLEEFFSRALTQADLETMDTDRDGQVSKDEFLAYMLVTLQLVGQEDIDALNSLFQTLDKDKAGVLHKEDLVDMSWNRSMSRSIADLAQLRAYHEHLDTSPSKRTILSAQNRQALGRWANRARLPGGAVNLRPANEGLPTHGTDNRNGAPAG